MSDTIARDRVDRHRGGRRGGGLGGRAALRGGAVRRVRGDQPGRRTRTPRAAGRCERGRPRPRRARRPGGGRSLGGRSAAHHHPDHPARVPARRVEVHPRRVPRGHRPARRPPRARHPARAGRAGGVRPGQPDRGRAPGRPRRADRDLSQRPDAPGGASGGHGRHAPGSIRRHPRGLRDRAARRPRSRCWPSPRTPLTGAGAFAAAVELGQLLLRTNPAAGAWSSYNLACSLARLGRTDEALLALDAAIRRGWDDPDLLDSDPDLASLRTAPGYDRVARPRRLDACGQAVSSSAARTRLLPEWVGSPSRGSIEMSTTGTTSGSTPSGTG